MKPRARSSGPLVALLVASCPAPRPPATGPGSSPANTAPAGTEAAAAGLKLGVVSPNVKVRPGDRPSMDDVARLEAARNEFVPFQIVLVSRRAVPEISASVTRPPSGPTTIPARNITLYRVAYHEVTQPSSLEGAKGLWPDPLIPDRDPYVGERRRAFPFELPAEQTRVIWVDLLVPRDAPPGDYRGEIAVVAADRKLGTVPIELRVADLTLPSSSSLTTAYALEFDEPCRAHTGFESCGKAWDEQRAYALRERYLRAALEHRVTIHDPFFQPPFDQSVGPFEAAMLPLIDGSSARLRLPGARLGALRLDAEKREAIGRWLAYAKKRGFAERLLYFPVDEPTDEGWARFARLADRLHAVDAQARILLTTTLADAMEAGVADKIDILAPALDALLPREGGTALQAARRWRRARPRRALWSYLSCRSHGCDDCGAISRDPGDQGWPSRVIDASAVQNRAFPWIAFRFGLEGEVYGDVARKLGSAWRPGGQCFASGAGEGTLFYPGTPERVGGKTHIPVESIRLKLIREGLEDYELLLLAAKKARARTEAIAAELFPAAHECAQPAARLERARRALFALLVDKE